MFNVELKARCSDLDAAEQVCRRLDAQHAGTDHQVDTYFAARDGRLKLRTSDLRPAHLIWYDRADEAGAKGCRYAIVEVDDADAVRTLLAAALGVRITVDKVRRIFLHDNVRIHLDQVEGLGAFIEFEAVMQDDAQAAAGRDQVERLRAAFGIRDGDLVARSYSDLLTDKRQGPPCSR